MVLGFAVKPLQWAGGDSREEQVADAKDAVSAPDKSLLVVQSNNKLKVYMAPFDAGDKPVLEVDIGEKEKIILDQWCEGDYVVKWRDEVGRIQ